VLLCHNWCRDGAADPALMNLNLTVQPYAASTSDLDHSIFHLN
jgi:hypothetical protein